MTRRGAVHTIDAFLASLVVTMALLYTFQAPIEPVIHEYSSINAQGYQILLRLDANGTLGNLIDSSSWGEMETLLRVSLPQGVTFNLTVIDENGALVNDRTISNGGLRGRTIESIDYTLAGQSPDCPLYKVRLQLGK